jgi:hypothetical protein
MPDILNYHLDYTLWIYYLNIYPLNPNYVKFLPIQVPQQIYTIFLIFLPLPNTTHAMLVYAL